MNNLLNFKNDDDFTLNLEGFEGPIHLLLELARSQKVDLSKISILKLADQYLQYINFVHQINSIRHFTDS